MSKTPEWKPADEAMFWLNELEKMQGGANGPTIKLRAALLAMGEPVSATIEARAPLNDAQALALARKHLDQGLSWAPHIVRCTDLEVRALIRAVEAAHGIGA